MTNTIKIDTSDSLTTKIEVEINSKIYNIEEKRKTPSEQNVLEVIDKILKKSGTKLEDLNSLHVKTGPGSFTGLRVGVSIVNALSFSLGIPVNNKKNERQELPSY